MAGTFADPDFAEMPIDELSETCKAAVALFGRIPSLSSTISPFRLKVRVILLSDCCDGDGMMVFSFSPTTAAWVVDCSHGARLHAVGPWEAFTEDGHLNIYAPGKRPFHTIIPAFLMKGDQPFMSYGLLGAVCSLRVTFRSWSISRTWHESSGSGRCSAFLTRWRIEPDEGWFDYGPYLEPGVPAGRSTLCVRGHKVKATIQQVSLAVIKPLAVTTKRVC